jgi:hypothetical protein
MHFVTRLQLLVSRRTLCNIYRLIEIVPTVLIEIVPTVPIKIVPTVLVEIVPKVEHKKQLSNTKPTSSGGSDCHTGKPRKRGHKKFHCNPTPVTSLQYKIWTVK